MMIWILAWMANNNNCNSFELKFQHAKPLPEKKTLKTVWQLAPIVHPSFFLRNKIYALFCLVFHNKACLCNLFLQNCENVINYATEKYRQLLVRIVLQVFIATDK